jgi:hypothetical protein
MVREASRLAARDGHDVDVGVLVVDAGVGHQAAVG